MNLAAFQRALLETGRYETPGECLDERDIRTRLGYHLAQMRVFYACNRVAKRGDWCRPVWVYLSYRAWRCVERAGVACSVEGYENFAAAGGPCVIVANHMSMLETIMVPVLVLTCTDLCIVMKESLLHYPVTGVVMRAIEPITVGRENPRDDLKAVLEGGARVLESGKSLLIFPQATRDPCFRRSLFNSMGAKLAARTGVPLVPLALKTDFHGVGRVLRDFGPLDYSKPVHFAFGPAMRVQDKGKAEHQACMDFIADRLEAWGGETAT